MNKIQKFYIAKLNILDSPIFLSEKSLHRLVTKKFDLFVALWSTKCLLRIEEFLKK